MNIKLWRADCSIKNKSMVQKRLLKINKAWPQKQSGHKRDIIRCWSGETRMSTSFCFWILAHVKHKHELFYRSKFSVNTGQVARQWPGNLLNNVRGRRGESSNVPTKPVLLANGIFTKLHQLRFDHLIARGVII